MIFQNFSASVLQELLLALFLNTKKISTSLETNGTKGKSWPKERERERVCVCRNINKFILGEDIHMSEI